MDNQPVNGNSDSEYFESNDLLYHFSSRVKAFEGIFVDQEGMKLKFGTFTKTNDPFEFESKWPIAQLQNYMHSHQGKSSLRAHKNTTKLDQLFNELVSFISFSMNDYRPDGYLKDFGFNKPRMWAQYGDNHYGMCFVFSKREIDNYFQGAILEEKVMSSSVSYKIYRKEFSNVFDELGKISNQHELESKFKNLIDVYSKHFFFQKHKDYEHESEYRYVKIGKNSIVEGIPLLPSLKAIILGHRFNIIYYPILLHVVKIFEETGRELPIYRFFWDVSDGELKRLKKEDINITGNYSII